MQDVQVDEEDVVHWKHPFLRRSREHVLAGQRCCADPDIATDVLLYLDLIVLTSIQLSSRFLETMVVNDSGDCQQAVNMHVHNNIGIGQDGLCVVEIHHVVGFNVAVAV